MKHSFKKAFRTLLVSAAVMAMATVGASACTTIYVGGNLVEEGTPFVARTEDYGSHMNKLWMISEAGEFKQGETYLGCPGYGEFEWKWTHDSYRFTHFSNDVFPTCPECDMGDAENPCPHYSYTEFGTNEHGLSVSATETIYGNSAVKKVDPLVQQKVDGKVGIEETDIPTILLAEAKTAREGIELLCDIYDEYGAYFESGVFVCDKNEIWYIENCSGHEYVAVKLNNDMIFLEPNIAVIGRVDLDDTENVIASPKLIEVAEKAGTFVGDKAENIIDFRASYAPLDRVGAPRMTDGLNYLDSSLNCTEDDLLKDNTMFTISNLKDGKIVPMYTNIKADRELDKNDVFGYYKLPSIGKSSNQEIEIFQLFQDPKRPVEESTVGWVGVGDMSCNAFVPYYPMLMTDVYEGYQVSTAPVVKSYEKPENFDGFMIVQPTRKGTQYIMYPENWRDSYYFTFEGLGSLVKYAEYTRGWPLTEQEKAMVKQHMDTMQMQMNETFAKMDPKDTTKVGMEMSAAMHREGLAMIDKLMTREGLYPDVQTDDWFYDVVYYATQKGYMAGYDNGCFGPYDPMTRAQVAQAIYNAGQATPGKLHNVFKDVPDGKWFSDAVNFVAEMEFVSGYGNGYFGVDDAITRQDMAVIIYNMNEKGGTDMVDETLPLDFVDADEVSDYAVLPMKLMVQNGLMAGTPENKLEPKREMTRAEFAQVLWNLDMF